MSQLAQEKFVGGEPPKNLLEAEENLMFWKSFRMAQEFWNVAEQTFRAENMWTKHNEASRWLVYQAPQHAWSLEYTRLSLKTDFISMTHRWGTGLEEDSTKITVQRTRGYNYLKCLNSDLGRVNSLGELVELISASKRMDITNLRIEQFEKNSEVIYF